MRRSLEANVKLRFFAAWKNPELVEIEPRKYLRLKYILWIKSIHKKKKNEIDRILLLGHYTNYNQ